jgi:hypothetical protein
MDPSATSAGPLPVNRANLEGEIDLGVAERLLHERNQRGLRKIVLNFTPSYVFTVRLSKSLFY